MLPKLVVDAEDGGRQGQELGTHYKVAIGYLFIVSNDD